MTVTITGPQPLPTVIGPGAGIRIGTDRPPLPGEDCKYHILIQNGVPNGHFFYEVTIPCTGPVDDIVLMSHPSTTTVEQEWYPRNDINTRLRIEQILNGVVNGQANLDGTWDNQLYLGQQIAATAQTQTQTELGFTAEDRALLTTTEERTALLGEAGQLVVQSASGPITTTLAQLFSRNSLDRLVLEEMTSGPTCSPVRVVLAPIAQFAIVVRVTTVPDDIQFKTPDNEWAFPDLAVLRIFRGQDLAYRRGIHEVTFETEAPWEWGANMLSKNLLGVPPPQTQVFVDWRAGCCGQVFIRHMP